jgi:hypothetical protein
MTDQNTEFEAIKSRHEAAKQARDDDRYYSSPNEYPPPYFPSPGGEQAHTDRATLITLVEAERARADKAEAELAEAKQALKVQASAIKTLQAAEDTEINVLRKGATDAHRAVATLDSERAMNATLTEENERLQAELAALREAAGKALLSMKLLQQNSEACAVQHHDKPVPHSGWLADTARDLRALARAVKGEG